LGGDGDGREFGKHSLKLQVRQRPRSIAAIGIVRSLSTRERAVAEASKQVVRRIYDEVFSQGAVDVVDEVVSADAIDHSPPPIPVEDVRDGLKQFTQMLRSAFPDARVTVNEMVAEGDLVAVYYTMTGTHQGDFVGMPATGARVSMEGFDLIRVQDGMCTEHWGVQDNAGLLQQLGGPPPD
jgi:steroid delta-isomerase-like uncharacterized protein